MKTLIGFLLVGMCLVYGCPNLAETGPKTNGVHKIVVPKNDLRKLSNYFPWTPSDSRRTHIPGPTMPKPAEGK